MAGQANFSELRVCLLLISDQRKVCHDIEELCIFDLQKASALFQRKEKLHIYIGYMAYLIMSYIFCVHLHSNKFEHKRAKKKMY